MTYGLGQSNTLLTLGLVSSLTAVTTERVIPLITELDSFEIVRDKIAEILALETVLQQNQATAEGLDPEGWRFRVYKERMRPWDIYRDSSDKSPIVNVWYDSDSTDKGKSNNRTQWHHTGRYNVDCIAYAVSEETATGHMPGDEAAALAAHKIGRIVRRILVHNKYDNFGLSEVVWDRWLSDRQSFKPTDKGAQNVRGFRLAFDVEYNEAITLQPENLIELIDVNFLHEPNGQVMARLRYEV